MKKISLILAVVAFAGGGTAYLAGVNVKPAPRATPVPLRLDDMERWVADNGEQDRVGEDYFDRLAVQVWHLPLGRDGVGWAHTPVLWLGYAKAHRVAFFVFGKRPGVEGFAMGDYTYRFFGCADSRNGRLVAGCPGLLVRKD